MDPRLGRVVANAKVKAVAAEIDQTANLLRT